MQRMRSASDATVGHGEAQMLAAILDAKGSHVGDRHGRRAHSGVRHL